MYAFEITISNLFLCNFVKTRYRSLFPIEYWLINKITSKSEGRIWHRISKDRIGLTLITSLMVLLPTSLNQRKGNFVKSRNAA